MLSDLQQTAEQRTTLEQQVMALQSSYSFADCRYQGGQASYLDVSTAQHSLFESELTLARTSRNQLIAVVQLYKAFGGGWQAVAGVSVPIATGVVNPDIALP